MNRNFILGEGRFKFYRSVDDLKSAGYISGIRVRELITEYLLSDPRDYGGLRKYMDDINNSISRVKVGIGKSVRYYYYEGSVMSAIQEIKKGNSICEKREDITKSLKELGYISGNDLKKEIYATLEVWSTFDSFSNSEFLKLYKYIMSILPNGFAHIYGKDSVKKVGLSRGVRYYYKKNSASNYVKEILPLQYEDYKGSQLNK